MFLETIFHYGVKKISPILKIWADWYFSKPRNYSYKNIDIKIFPTVFFPHFTISTKLLIDFLESKTLASKTFLELGCGTGIISVFAAKKNAMVTASDINSEAIKNALFNAKLNDVKIEAIESDLFQKMEGSVFDLIVINPPYYPKNPKNMAENAWFCGENFEYFNQLFLQLDKHIHSKSEVYMILSIDCEIKKIEAIAFEQNFQLSEIQRIKVNGELNFIFEIAQV